MEKSEKIDELMAALMEAQKAFPVVDKSHTANAGSYGYRYADLPDIVAAVRPVLYDCGLVVSQFPDGNGLTTVLAHPASGQWLEATADFSQTGLTAQALGSWITYMRRYAYCAATGVVADEDDDGAAASQGAPIRAAAAARAAVADRNRPAPSGNKVYLDVPFNEKDAVKAAGGRWDQDAKRWYVPEGKGSAVFAAWLPGEPEDDLGEYEDIRF